MPFHNGQESTKARPSDRDDDLQIVLASGSPRRRDILTLAGLRFDVCSDGGDVVEIEPSEEPDPQRLTLRNATLKLDSAVGLRGDSSSPNRVTIAADTTVAVDGEIFGKPADRSEATDMLERLRGRQHQVFTSVAVGMELVGSKRQTRVRSVESLVKMRKYEDEEVERYIASGIPFDRAGAYGIQDVQFDPAESVSGCYLNVVGLPLCALRELLPVAAATFADTHVYAPCAAHERGAVE